MSNEQISFSRIEKYNACPYAYYLKYVKDIKCFDDLDSPVNHLFVGIGFHKGVEEGVEEGVKEYFNCYPCINQNVYDESLKLEYIIPRVKQVLPKGGKYELKIGDDGFVGYIDYCVVDGQYIDIYDFKYSNKYDKYAKSLQLSVYALYVEKLGYKVRKLCYICVPKSSLIRGSIFKCTQKEYDTFTNKLYEDLERHNKIYFVNVPYNKAEAIKFINDFKNKSNTDFPKKITYLCKFCEYKEICQKGDYSMALPKYEIQDKSMTSKLKVWVYGQAGSGKSTFANTFPRALILGTDGNREAYDQPYILITNTVSGRTPVLAWKSFISVINDLKIEAQKPEQEREYQTVVIDLIEDIYEFARSKVYEDLKITHESDDNFKAWDIVTKTFLDAIKDLVALPFNIVFVSHEDTTKDITKRSGDKITSIQPNIREKVAKKLCGMVRLVVRMEDNFKLWLGQEANVTGLYRGLNLPKDSIIIEPSYNAILDVYKDYGITINQRDNAAALKSYTPTEHEVESLKEQNEGDLNVEVENINVAKPVEEVQTTEQPKNTEQPKRRLLKRVVKTQEPVSTVKNDEEIPF